MADALLVVDVQRELVETLAPERRAAFLATLTNLIERARSRGAELVYVRHEDGCVVHRSAAARRDYRVTVVEDAHAT